MIVEHRFGALFVLLEACCTFVGVAAEKFLYFDHVCSHIKQKVGVLEGLEVFLDGLLSYVDLLVGIKM
jgi:hypothetical protein